MRALPRLDSLNRDFWTGGEHGELRIMHCNDCDGYIHPPRPVCRHCLSENVSAKAVSGRGVIDTYTINHQAWHPKMEVPFVIARVALSDAPGVIITSNIIGCSVDDVDIGDEVSVVFEQQDDVFIPLFEKVK
ncbi:Zn-ribbon domain-containing OB-fold protein [Zhongshania aquimaris]|uniref:OB-fold domain-containing protein n=1 Tax=Zhongshania aquimaris TaxID=2857107 RepID=A0ABS6VXR0_9GAMM|nr:OB-fold domain-containing protein [Zhongshania aquimaris]MBW2942475.1 OB-fold domain-containing protein [Zhongshania aquimaris]